MDETVAAEVARGGLDRTQLRRYNAADLVPIKEPVWAVEQEAGQSAAQRRGGGERAAADAERSLVSIPSSVGMKPLIELV